MMKIKRLKKQMPYFLVLVGVLLTLLVACKQEPPQIDDIKGSAGKVEAGKSVELDVDILSNPSNIGLTFEWSADRGTIDPPSGSKRVTYHAPDKEGNATVSLTVKNSDTGAPVANKTYSLQIVSPPVVTPQISDIKSSKGRVTTGKSVGLDVDVLSNPSGLSLTFDWSTDKGTIDPPSGKAKVTYHAPDTEGSATVSLTVKNSATGAIVATKTHQLQIVPKPTPVGVLENFVLAGWMGNTQAITLDDSCTENPHSPPVCVKITYRILPGSVGWAGIYAQYNVRGPGNWGDRPGMNLSDYTKLVFYARGATGKNEMVEFKAGGVDTPGKPHRDSFERSMGTIKLEKEWKRYEIDLSNEDLSSVIGGFCWVATKRSNPNGLTFYVDSITYE